ncbi:MAG: Fic family protein [Selenomonadaceae bacterium]|nr:Fic family protein [Selenomonadaceae bacterium]
MDKYAAIVSFWQNKKISNVAELEVALNGHIILFAYHSGKIENSSITYNDTREIFEHDGVTSYTGDLKTLFEIHNAREASRYMFAAYENRIQLDESFIKKLHYELTKGTYDTRRFQLGERPGHFKKHDYVTGIEEVGALPEDVNSEILELLDEIKNVQKRDVLTAAAYFHAKFENIHPFADGNGRVGRLATNYFFIQNDHPPIIFHEDSKKSYYSSLEAWDRSQNIEAMKLYLKMETVRTWEKQLGRKVYCK